MQEFSLDPDQSRLTFYAAFNKHKAARVGRIASEMQRLTAAYCKSFGEGVEAWWVKAESRGAAAGGGETRG